MSMHIYYFKNILTDVQKGDKYDPKTTLKIVHFDNRPISVEGLKSKISYYTTVFYHLIFLTIYDSICQLKMPAHYLIL